MTKNTDMISDVVRDTKTPFRDAMDRRVKVQKHRYERRKIREYMRLADWLEEA
jgi:hypothetical protein